MAEPLTSVLPVGPYVAVPLAIVVYSLTLLHGMAADLRIIRRVIEDRRVRR